MTEVSTRGARIAFGLRGKYMSLTTFRRDGSPVPTPVWFVVDGDRVLVQTDAQAGKVKRIRRNPAVTVAACTATGRLKGSPTPGRAEVLPPSARAGAEALMASKYKADIRIVKGFWAIQKALGVGRKRTTPVIIAITLEH
jgi:PPOX class probable F420-dependent enzyme